MKVIDVTKEEDFTNKSTVALWPTSFGSRQAQETFSVIVPLAQAVPLGREVGATDLLKWRRFLFVNICMLLGDQ